MRSASESALLHAGTLDFAALDSAALVPWCSAALVPWTGALLPWYPGALLCLATLMRCVLCSAF